MSVQLTVSVWDYHTQKSSMKMGESLLGPGESLELVNRLFMSSANVHCRIVDMGDQSFAISFEYVTQVPRFERLAPSPVNHYGYLYWFGISSSDGTEGADLYSLRHMVRAFALAYPDLCSDNVKAYLANPLSLV